MRTLRNENFRNENGNSKITMGGTDNCKEWKVTLLKGSRKEDWRTNKNCITKKAFLLFYSKSSTSSRHEKCFYNFCSDCRFITHVERVFFFLSVWVMHYYSGLGLPDEINLDIEVGPEENPSAKDGYNQQQCCA